MLLKPFVRWNSCQWPHNLEVIREKGTEMQSPALIAKHSPLINAAVADVPCLTGRKRWRLRLIRALRAVRRAIPDVLYSIVGDGEERPGLQQRVQQEGLSAAVQLP